ncbi:MAG: EamA family transporter [Planctomycetes bacterium]|nr:EamA family transporter [Planctomycetota bacterium]
MWASLVAVARGVQSQMGVLPSAAVANLLGGIIGLVIGVGAGPKTRVEPACSPGRASRRSESRFLGWAPGRRGRVRRMLCLPPDYLLGCGGLFVLYNLSLYRAIDRAATHAQTIEVGLINYLWPALTLALAVPLLKKRAGAWLWPGLALATAGAFWAVSRGSISWTSFRSGLAVNPWPYGLALTAAASWALYSNLARRWAAGTTHGAVPLFLIATGIALGALHAMTDRYLHLPLSVRAFAELAYLTLFPTLLAYVLWDIAMRKGNVILVTSLSFFTPLLSTVISCLYLGVPLGGDLLMAAGLIVAGAVICQASVRPR